MVNTKISKRRERIKALQAEIEAIEAAERTQCRKVEHQTLPAVVGHLRRILKDEGISQKELAKRSNVSQPVISRLLSGRHSPNLRTLDKVADATGHSLNVQFVKAA